MESESRLWPILGHLAWLAENVDTPSNRGRAHDAAVLTYNAAARLKWHFVFPVSDMDTTADPAAHDEAAGLIDGLVMTARKAVTSAKDDATQDERIRSRLSRAIRRVVDKIPYLLLVGNPVPKWLPELQLAPDIAGLMDEFLGAHYGQYGPAIAKGKASANIQRMGPDAAVQEAIAWLAYAHSPTYAATATPKERNGLAQMAAGYLKTAVDMQRESHVPAPKRRRLQDLAQRLVEEAAEGGDA